MAAATPHARFVEVFTDDTILAFSSLRDRPSRIEEADAVLDDWPGLGFDLEGRAVARHQLAPWRALSESVAP